MSLDLSLSHTFRCAEGSRRGEWIAWALAALSLISIVIIQELGVEIGIGSWLFIVLLFSMALIISIGNWMNRKTLIVVNGTGIRYGNGLRDVFLPWDTIDSIEVIPADWGKHVFIQGTHARFAFRTGAVVEWKGRFQEHVGMINGETLLETIVMASGLVLKRADGRYYYTRE